MNTIYCFLLLCVLSTPVYADDDTNYTDSLDGTNITYTYTSGRSYNVKFESAGVSYRYLTGTKPEKWWGPFPYKALVTAQGEFLVAWHEPDYGDYITLLINMEAEVLYGSGIIGSSSTHFEKAHICNIEH